MEFWATFFGSGHALTWGQHSGGLHFGGLESHATDFGSAHALTGAYIPGSYFRFTF